MIHLFFPVVCILILQRSDEHGNSHNSLKHVADDMSGPLSPISVPAQKQLKYSAGIANASVRESAAFIDQARKVFCASCYLAYFLHIPLGYHHTFACRWCQLGTWQWRNCQQQGMQANCGGGRGAITNGFYNLNGSGKNLGDSRSWLGTVTKQSWGHDLVHRLCQM